MAKICRLCLKITDEAFYFIDDNAAIKNRNKILILMPELALDVVPDPIICSLCYGTLQVAYEFKRNCLANEQRLTDYLRNNKNRLINLCDLLVGNDSKSVFAENFPGDSYEADENASAFVHIKEESEYKTEASEVPCEFECVYQDSYREISNEEEDEKADEGSKTGEPPVKCIKCSRCSREFTAWKDYKKHSVQCAPYECDVCNKKFKLNCRFLKHKATHNANAEMNAPGDLSNETNASPKPDEQEEEEGGEEEEEEEEEEQEQEQEEGEEVDDKTDKSSGGGLIKGRVKCSNCSTEFTVWKDYRKHIKLCAPYKCDVCNKKFIKEGRFLRHKVMHKAAAGKSDDAKADSHRTDEDCDEAEINVGIKCSRCHNKFMQKRDYRRHIQKCAPYQCDVCNKKFMLETRLQQHKLAHQKEQKTFLCEICSKTFRQAYLLGQHLLLHSGLKPYKCQKCDKAFATRNHFRMHQQAHLMKEKRNVHACDMCEKKFPNVQLLWRHINTHSYVNLNKETSSEKEKDEPGNKTCSSLIRGSVKCSNCSTVFVDWKEYRNHMDQCATYECDICLKKFIKEGRYLKHKLTHKDTEETNAEAQSGETEINVGIKCSICHNKFMTKKDYRKHVDQCAPYQCSVCGKKFILETRFEQHKLSHKEEKTFLCDVCSKTFKKSYLLGQHLLLHSGRKPYQCPTCGKAFPTRNQYRMHQRTHLTNPKERGHTCEICERKFPSLQFLRRHTRAHLQEKKMRTGEEPYGCDDCGERFNLKSDLHVHSFLHTENARRFPCLYCHKTFFLSKHLKRHIKRHVELPSHVCVICGKRFGESSSLKRHMRTHTGEKPFECEVCHEKYRYQYTLLVHMKMHSEDT